MKWQYNGYLQCRARVSTYSGNEKRAVLFTKRADSTPVSHLLCKAASYGLLLLYKAISVLISHVTLAGATGM